MKGIAVVGITSFTWFHGDIRNVVVTCERPQICRRITVV